MINVILKNESNWVIHGSIISDIDIIDLYSDEFKISLKDVFEHYIKRDNAYDSERAIDKDLPILTISNNEYDEDEDFYFSNVSEYNNSDSLSLIKNGFQFWVSDDKKVLEFRVCARGQSTLNPDGYYDKIMKCYSKRVGISCGVCSISLDSTHNIEFNILISPKLKPSDIYRLKNEIDLQIPTKANGVYPTCRLCDGTGYIVSGEDDTSIICPACNGEYYYQDRYAYPYDYMKVKDIVYLNNNPNTYSSTQTTYWNENRYELSSISGKGWQTPLYGATTSAFMPVYLSEGITIDILNPEISANRGLDFNWNEAQSILIEDNKTKYSDIAYTMDEYEIKNFEYFEYKDNSIYDDMYLNLITQTISADDIGVRGKKLQFRVDI